MSTDIEKLIVSLSADFKSYENAMAKASGITRKQLAQIKADAANAGAGATTAFTGASAGVARFGKGAATAGKSVNALQGQTANLASQFQDIAVQLQGGASPFTIALQQGTQISSVLGGQGARGAVAALGGAFASLVSPVSLVTIGLITAGGAAVQYFAGLSDDGEKSAEELKKQSALIQQVAKDWGDAVPAVKAYADAVERAQQVADLRESGAILREQAFADAKEQVASLSEALLVLRSDLELLAGPQDVAKISDLQNAFNALEDSVKNNQDSTQEAEAVQVALNAVMALGAPTADGFASSLGALSGALAGAAATAAQAESSIAGAISQMQQFRAAEAASMQGLVAAESAGKRATAEIERQNSLTQEQIDLERERGQVRDEIADKGGIATPDTINRLADERIAADERRAAAAKAAAKAASDAAKEARGSGGGGSAAKEAEREREAVTKLIEQLQFEQNLIGATAVEREKANALRRAGSAATDEQRAQIEGLVAASYAETEALKASEDAMERMRGLSKEVLGGMFEDLRDGASAADILSNALNRVAENLVKVGIDNLIGSIGAPGAAKGGLFGGAIIPGILHSGGVAGRDGYGHGRSVSPGVFAGARRYHSGGVAGLQPGEVPAILQKGEVVIPKAGFRNAAGGGNVAVTFAPNIDARGADMSVVARLEAQMRVQEATFSDRVATALRSPRRR